MRVRFLFWLFLFCFFNLVILAWAAEFEALGDLTVPNGSVAIGRSGPAAKLHIQASGSGTGLSLLIQDSAGTGKVAILDNGNLGIGYTAPANKLKVIGDIVGDTGTFTTLTVGGQNVVSVTTNHAGDVTGPITGLTVVDDSHDHSAAGSTVTINAADIIDKNAGTDITADLEEEVTEGSLADSTIVSADIKDGTITAADTALTAGRSLTLTTNDFAADTELYTNGFSINIETPTTADNGKFSTKAFTALTITEVSCSCDSGTVTINMDERAWATPDTNGTDVLSAGLACDTNGQSSCASGCDVDTINNAGIDVTDPIALEISATTGSPTVVRVHVKYTKDD